MSRRTRDGLQLGAVPTIDLTPPEVKAKRQGTGLRRALVMAFVGSLAIVALAFGASFLLAANAQGQLQSARDESAQLLAQQQEFSEVITIASRTRQITAARENMTEPEVLWKPFLDQVASVLPNDATFTSIVATGRLATDPELVPVGALRKPLVASLTITIGSPTVPDAAAWMRRIATLPGYADHSLTSVTQEESRYLVTVSINLSDDALASRFAPVEEAATEPEQPTEDPIEAEGADQ